MEGANNTNNSKVVWLTIVFVLLAVGLWSVIGSNPFSLLNKKGQEKKEVPKVEVLSIDKDLAILESRANFPVSTVKNSVNVSEVAKELTFLILADASEQSVKKETYTNGNSGWSISYQSADNVMNVYNNLYSAVRNAGFKINFSSRTFSAAIVSADSVKYKIKATAQYLNDKNALVRISVVANN